MNSPSNYGRLHDLFADEAVFGLTPSDCDERDLLLRDHPGESGDAYERAAATYYLAAAPLAADSLPQSLRAAVLLSFQASGTETQSIAPATIAQPAPRPNRTPIWLAAVAASLLIGFFLGRPVAEPGGDPVAVVAPRQALDELLASNAAITRVAWTATEDPAAVFDEGVTAAGEVFWSDAKQEGYMTFRGLAANDPTQEQYQLWIFDAERDDAYPVDGGVFDIPAGADEVVTRIDVKIPVTRAIMFAITVEKPGGVVVSDRSRLPLLAKVD